MKKVIYNEYGNADVLQLVDVSKPEPDNTKVLVKVKSVSINPLDWKIFKGEAKSVVTSHFPKGVGLDFSGIIEQVSSEVKDFKIGDEVFGIAKDHSEGTLAEYIVLSADEIALKPDNISFEQAAAMAVVGCSAVEIIDKLVEIKKGEEILINGASGGIGMIAIQLAKKHGALVTAAVSDMGIDSAKQWGSDIVINYKQTDVLKEGKQYDAVVDLSAKMSFDDAKDIMKSSSTFVTTVPDLKVMAGSFVHDLVSKKKYKYLYLKANADDIKAIANYASEGLDILINKTYPMTSFKEAYTEMPEKSIAGKAVFTI